MCKWMVLETIDYFTKNGSEVFICVMDMKEAFDLAKWRKLSEKLLARNIPPVFLRLLLDMYADDLFLMVPTLDGLQTIKHARATQKNITLCLAHINAKQNA